MRACLSNNSSFHIKHNKTLVFNSNISTIFTKINLYSRYKQSIRISNFKTSLIITCLALSINHYNKLNKRQLFQINNKKMKVTKKLKQTATIRKKEKIKKKF